MMFNRVSELAPFSVNARTIFLALCACVAVACGGDESGFEPATRGHKCEVTNDCDDGLVCLTGTCQKQCASVRDCPKSEQCNADSICEQPAEVLCKSDAECADAPSACHRNPGACWGGQCEYAPLETGAECSQPDKAGPCTGNFGICDTAGACIYTTKINIACRPLEPTALCEAIDGVCNTDGICEKVIDVGAECMHAGGVGSCETPVGYCDPSGACLHGILDPGTVCLGRNDPCIVSWACDNKGLCVGDPVPCQTPPENECVNADTVEVHRLDGICVGGVCNYSFVEATCDVAGTCGDGLSCLLTPCDDSDVVCPPQICAASGRCEGGLCKYQSVGANVLCDADEDGTDDGVCDGPGNCRSDLCLMPLAVGPVADGGRDPGNDCNQCDPDANRSNWTGRAIGSLCTTPLGTAGVCPDAQDSSRGCLSGECYIDGVFVPKNQNRPSNPCSICDPAVDHTSYSQASDYHRCVDFGLCKAGQCERICYIDGVEIAADTPYGLNDCLVCDPAQNAYDWSPRRSPVDFVCELPSGGDGFCSGGLCGLMSCYIGGQEYSNEDLSVDGCAICDSSSSLSSWTPRAEGASCAGGFCGDGFCQAGSCLIDGLLVPGGAANPTNECGGCDFASDPSGWSSAVDGTACLGGSGICLAGACEAARCWDGSVSYPAGDVGGGCALCDPAQSFALQTLPNGADCGGLGVYGRCNGGACDSQSCYIEGALYTGGAHRNTNFCEACEPSSNSWAAVDNGDYCGLGCVCWDAVKTEVLCTDSVDNDGDAALDCADADCDGAYCGLADFETIAAADAEIRRAYPDTNYGTLDTITVGKEYLSGYYFMSFLLQFDISAFPAASVGEIEGIDLLLHQSSARDSGLDTVGLRQNLAPWVEADVTWNTAPAAGSTEKTFQWSYSFGINRVVDITSIVLAWITDPTSNHGFRFDYQESVNTQYRRTFSSNNASSNQPRIRIRYRNYCQAGVCPAP